MNHIKYYHKRACEILKTIKYATLATVTEEGEPWNSPVAHEWDDDLNIYWFSDKENQHSKNVRANGDVFIVIYDSTVPEGDGEGLYIQARVEEINDAKEIDRIMRIKKVDGFKSNPGEFLDDAIRRVYKASPLKLWMNDAEVKDGVFIRDYKVELDADKIKELI